MNIPKMIKGKEQIIAIGIVGLVLAVQFLGSTAFIFFAFVFGGVIGYIVKDNKDHIDLKRKEMDAFREWRKVYGSKH